MSTKQVADLIGVAANTLVSGIRNGRFPTPAKNAHGFYDWSEQDVANLRSLLSIDRRKTEHRRRTPA